MYVLHKIFQARIFLEEVLKNKSYLLHITLAFNTIYLFNFYEKTLMCRFFYPAFFGLITYITLNHLQV